ncbi:LPS translocon maturation chaperone LptM [Marilutibacter maris]|uniref:Sugar transporter n=1 Tax=Marilutibacter maris TaxID=1605891 RepID=A0A507ZYT4_9GAMM|nr:lipoprotein [Lysobacter maris]KAB8161362.1 sugar transporter [Lysobacter maris]
MNARTALSLLLLSLAMTACGNKGPLVQAPADMPIEVPVDAASEPDPGVGDAGEAAPPSDPDVEDTGDDEGPGAE